MYFAWGNGGQFIIMLPEQKTVMVITTWRRSREESKASRTGLFEFIEGQLISYLERSL